MRRPPLQKEPDGPWSSSTTDHQPVLTGGSFASSARDPGRVLREPGRVPLALARDSARTCGLVVVLGLPTSSVQRLSVVVAKAKRGAASLSDRFEDLDEGEVPKPVDGLEGPLLRVMSLEGETVPGSLEAEEVPGVEDRESKGLLQET